MADLKRFKADLKAISYCFACILSRSWMAESSPRPHGPWWGATIIHSPALG